MSERDSETVDLLQRVLFQANEHSRLQADTEIAKLKLLQEIKESTNSAARSLAFFVWLMVIAALVVSFKACAG